MATGASVLGGLLGYGIGAMLFDSIGQPVLEFYGKAESMEAFNHRFNEWGRIVLRYEIDEGRE